MADRKYILRVIAEDDFLAEFQTNKTLTLIESLGISLSFIVSASIIGMSFTAVFLARQQQKHVTELLVTSRRTHNVIVGYVCHELRNPLHVLHTWFQVLLKHHMEYATAKATAKAKAGEPEDDLQLAMMDVAGALGQMRSTVNDVLDHRRVMYNRDTYSVHTHVGPLMDPPVCNSHIHCHCAHAMGARSVQAASTSQKQLHFKATHNHAYASTLTFYACAVTRAYLKCVHM